jgi:hypothetical protein
MMFSKPQLCKRVMSVKNEIQRIPATYHKITQYLRPLNEMTKLAPCSKVTHLLELCTPMNAFGINIKCHYAECHFTLSIFSYCCTKHHYSKDYYVFYCFPECCGTKILEWINVIVKSQNVDI